MSGGQTFGLRVPVDLAAFLQIVSFPGSSVEIHRWSPPWHLGNVERVVLTGVWLCVAINIENIGDPHSQVCTSFLCFNVMSAYSPGLPLFCPSSGLSAWWSDLNTNGLPAFCFWVPFLHGNASLNRSGVKSSQHLLLIVHLWPLQGRIYLTGARHRIAAWCASPSVAAGYGLALQPAMMFQEGGLKEIFSFCLKITRSRSSLVAKWTLLFCS